MDEKLNLKKTSVRSWLLVVELQDFKGFSFLQFQFIKPTDKVKLSCTNLYNLIMENVNIRIAANFLQYDLSLIIGLTVV